MENLFYDYDIDNKFDLKGSLRNRLVDPNNQNGEETVLLDENLIQSKSINQSFSQHDNNIVLFPFNYSVLVKSIVHPCPQQISSLRCHQS